MSLKGLTNGGEAGIRRQSETDSKNGTVSFKGNVGETFERRADGEYNITMGQFSERIDYDTISLELN